MPLPLYGSGGRTLRISAAVWPTICLSVPFTTTCVGTGTSNEMPVRGLIVTACGPPTATRPGSTDTVTPAGISIGLFPIRLMALPDKTDDLAADPALLRGPAGDETGRRGQNRDAHAAQHARQTVLPRVDPAARLR